jgi:hypothetical protein
MNNKRSEELEAEATRFANWLIHEGHRYSSARFKQQLGLSDREAIITSIGAYVYAMSAMMVASNENISDEAVTEAVLAGVRSMRNGVTPPPSQELN